MLKPTNSCSLCYVPLYVVKILCLFFFVFSYLIIISPRKSLCSSCYTQPFPLLLNIVDHVFYILKFFIIRHEREICGSTYMYFLENVCCILFFFFFSRCLVMQSSCCLILLLVQQLCRHITHTLHCKAPIFPLLYYVYCLYVLSVPSATNQIPETRSDVFLGL